MNILFTYSLVDLEHAWSMNVDVGLDLEILVFNGDTNMLAEYLIE